MTDREFRKCTRNRNDEPTRWEDRIELSEETREQIDRWIEEQRRFHDDLRLAALILGVDWLLSD